MRRWLPIFAVCALLQGCATSHLINWSKGESSAYQQPADANSIYIRPGATFIAFPFAVVFDVVTFPFQLIWDVYPYGEENAPVTFEGK